MSDATGMSPFADLLRRLRESRGWIAAFAALAVISDLADWWLADLLHHARSRAFVAAPIEFVLQAAWLVLLVGMMRAMIGHDEKRVQFLWGMIASALWMLPAVAIGLLLNLYPGFAWLRALCLLLITIVLVPFVAAATQWGWQLPWKRILGLIWNWRWWLVVLLAAVVGAALPDLILLGRPDAAVPSPGDFVALRKCAADLLTFVGEVGLLGCFAALLGRMPARGDKPHS